MPKRTSLVLLSFLTLFLELSLIRWLPAHIFSIAFFSNIVLIASFLGLGLGLLLSGYDRDVFRYFPWLLTGFVTFVLCSQNLQVVLPTNAQTWIWSYYYGNRLGNLSFLRVSLAQLVSVLFVFTAVLFVPLGQRIGKLMEAFNSLKGYTLNILGSLLGVVGFGLSSWVMAPAYVWFAIIGGILILVTAHDRHLLVRVASLQSWWSVLDCSNETRCGLHTTRFKRKRIRMEVCRYT